MQHLVLLSSDFRQLVSYKVCIMIESASMLQGDPFSRTALDWLISLMWAISPEEKIKNTQIKENRRQRHDHWKPTSMPSTSSVQQVKANILHISTFNPRSRCWPRVKYDHFVSWWLRCQEMTCMCEWTITDMIPQMELPCHLRCKTFLSMESVHTKKLSVVVILVNIIQTVNRAKKSCDCICVWASICYSKQIQVQWWQDSGFQFKVPHNVHIWNQLLGFQSLFKTIVTWTLVGPLGSLNKNVDLIA